MAFTSSWSKARWSNARKQQSLFNNRFGENVGVKEFYKNENPLINKVQKYSVTIEMDYMGQGYEFFIPQETFEIISFDSPENKNTIEENTKQAVSNIFRGKSKAWIYEHVKVTARGVEKGKLKYDDLDSDKLKTTNAYTENLPKIDVGKKPKGSKGNKNSYSLDLWL